MLSGHFLSDPKLVLTLSTMHMYILVKPTKFRLADSWQCPFGNNTESVVSGHVACSRALFNLMMAAHQLPQ